MSTIDDIANAIEIFRDSVIVPLNYMHSHSAYPMPVEEANLKM